MLERAVRWYFITVQYENQSHDSANLAFLLNAGLALGSAIDFDLQGVNSQFRRRLGVRAHTLTPRFYGESLASPVRIIGYQIEAAPLGFAEPRSSGGI